MIFGSFAYGSAAVGGSAVACPSPPSCNLIVMKLIEQSPGYLDLDEISRYVDNIIIMK